MKNPIQLHSSTLGLAFKDGKPYNYRSKEDIVIDADDIIKVINHYDKNNNPDMNFCTIIMDRTKFGDKNFENKIDVAEDFETILLLIKAQKLINSLV